MRRHNRALHERNVKVTVIGRSMFRMLSYTPDADAWSCAMEMLKLVDRERAKKQKKTEVFVEIHVARDNEPVATEVLSAYCPNVQLTLEGICGVVQSTTGRVGEIISHKLALLGVSATVFALVD